MEKLNTKISSEGQSVIHAKISSYTTYIPYNLPYYIVLEILLHLVSTVFNLQKSSSAVMVIFVTHQEL